MNRALALPYTAKPYFAMAESTPNTTQSGTNYVADRSHERHPQVGVGAVVFRGDAVLLVRRARPPYAGQWAIPGGRVHWGETLKDAAEREILEETGIRIRAGDPIYAFDIIEHDAEGDPLNCTRHYVVVDLAAEYLSGEPRAGDDAADARWVSAAEFNMLPINTTTLNLLKRHYDFG